MNFYFFHILLGLFLIFPGMAVQADDGRTLLNDLHSRLNPTEVQAVFYPQDSDDVIALVERAKNKNVPLSISDRDTFLPWAKQDYACVVVNLRVSHSDRGLKKAQTEFRRLIDRALERDGSYFLTYHRWARKDQVLQAYPQFPEFLKLKLQYDPDERFQSDWYRHYKEMFSVELGSEKDR